MYTRERRIREWTSRRLNISRRRLSGSSSRDGCGAAVIKNRIPEPMVLLFKISRRCIGVGAGQVGPVLTRPLFRKELVGVTIITINTCVLVRAAAACSASS